MLEDHRGALQLALAWAEAPTGGGSLGEADQPAVAALAAANRRLLDRWGLKPFLLALEASSADLRAAVRHAHRPHPPAAPPPPPRDRLPGRRRPRRDRPSPHPVVARPARHLRRRPP